MTENNPRHQARETPPRPTIRRTSLLELVPIQLGRLHSPAPPSHPFRLRSHEALPSCAGQRRGWGAEGERARERVCDGEPGGACSFPRSHVARQPQWIRVLSRLSTGTLQQGGSQPCSASWPSRTCRTLMGRALVNFLISFGWSACGPSTDLCAFSSLSLSLSITARRDQSALAVVLQTKDRFGFLVVVLAASARTLLPRSRSLPHPRPQARG